MTKLLRDTWLIFARSLMLTLRNPVWVFVGILQPVLYLALYAPLLGRCPSDKGCRRVAHSTSSCPACWCSSRCSRPSPASG
jgi:hypothetical protein